MSELLRIRARLAAPPARVFRALTDVDELVVWFAEHAEVALDEGTFAFWGRHTPQGEKGRQRLLGVEPGRSLRFAWTLDDVETAVELRLEPERPERPDERDDRGGSEGTVLTLRQDRMPTLDELMAPTGRRDGRHTMHTFWGLAIANLAEHVEGRPLTPRAHFGPDRAREIRVEMVIDAPPEEVFASLTDPAAIARWFGWEVAVEPRLGGRMELGVEGKIFEFEPGKRLVYGDDQGSVVRWELAGSQGRTHLTFVQSGYAGDELDSAAQHEAGWLGGLAELRRMHELGDAWTPLTTELPDDETGDDGEA